MLQKEKAYSLNCGLQNDCVDGIKAVLDVYCYLIKVHQALLLFHDQKLFIIIHPCQEMFRISLWQVANNFMKELDTTEDKMATCCSQVKKPCIVCIVYNASFKSRWCMIVQFGL